MRQLAITLTFALSTVVSTSAMAQEEFPSKPIRLIVPFGQGGSTSIQARTYQSAIEKNDILSEPIVVSYVPGAAGTIGARQIKDADSDGYNILIWHVAANGSKEMGNVDFGPEAFEAIAGTGRQCYFLVVRETSTYQTLDELLKAAKESPEEIPAGVNLGGANHIGALLAENALPGAQFRHVQTGGTAKVFPALLGGHVEVGLMPTSSINNVGTDGLRLLGYMAPERDPGFPDVPTFAEQGYPAQMCMTSWWFAPKGTPEERVETLADALEAAFETDEVKEANETQSVEHVFLRGEELDQAIAAEAEAIHRVGPRLRGTK